MKIIFVVPDMAGGGTEKVITLLANEYVKNGIAVDILMFAGSQVAYKLDERVKTISLGSASQGNFMVRVKRLSNMRKYFRHNKGSFIFSFSTYGTGFIVMSTIGMKFSMLVSERTDPRSCDHKTFRDFFYRFADKLVFQTEDAMNCFPKSIRKKAYVLPNPVDPDIPFPVKGERKKTIAAVGRLAPVKNYPMLIDAFSDFIKKNPEYTLHFYGQGETEAELKAQCMELGLSDKVVFHGFTENVKEEIADSGMFVLTSNYEGVSNAMVEALSMGVPVIATDCPTGGCRMYINSGKNGLLVPVGDVAALTKAMDRIANEEGLAEQLSEKAVLTKEECAVEQIADRLVQIAKKL